MFGFDAYHGLAIQLHPIHAEGKFKWTYFFVRMRELFAISILNSGHSSLQAWKSCSGASLSRIKDSKKNLDILNSNHFPDLSLYNDTYSVTDYRLHRALDLSKYFTFPLRAGDSRVQLKATPNKMGATIQFFFLPIWIFRAEYYALSERIGLQVYSWFT